MHEHVVWEAVARVDPVEVELLEHRQRERGEPGLRVGDVPVAGRDLRQLVADGRTSSAKAWVVANGARRACLLIELETAPQSPWRDDAVAGAEWRYADAAGGHARIDSYFIEAW